MYTWKDIIDNFYLKLLDFISDDNIVKLMTIVEDYKKYDLINHLFFFCVDGLTNNSRNRKNWVSEDNAHEFALASVMEVLDLKEKDLKNVNYDKKKLTYAINKIKSISNKDWKYIKKVIKNPEGWTLKLMHKTLKKQGLTSS